MVERESVSHAYLMSDNNGETRRSFRRIVFHPFLCETYYWQWNHTISKLQGIRLACSVCSVRWKSVSGFQPAQNLWKVTCHGTGSPRDRVIMLVGDVNIDTVAVSPLMIAASRRIIWIGNSMPLKTNFIKPIELHMSKHTPHLHDP